MPFKQYDVVRLVKLKNQKLISVGKFARQPPKIGDVATIIEVYQSPYPGYELECVDQDGRTLWICAFPEADVVLEPVRFES